MVFTGEHYRSILSKIEHRRLIILGTTKINGAKKYAIGKLDKKTNSVYGQTWKSVEIDYRPGERWRKEPRGKSYGGIWYKTEHEGSKTRFVLIAQKDDGRGE